MKRQHKPCYGAMFPQVHVGDYTGHAKGKVFSVDIERPGGFVSRRSIDADREQWDECVACEEFDGCYRLGMGKLSMEIAVAGR